MHKAPSTPSKVILLALVGAACLLWAIYWLFVVTVLLPVPEGGSSDALYARRGQFGDMFGAVNALFTALAFAGLLYTIFLQRRDLAIQGRNLALTLKEVRDQSEAFKKQNSILRDNLTYEVLVSILQEYRSVEMGVAVRDLWDFARANTRRLGEAYEEIRAIEAKAVEALDAPHRIEGARATLHFKRRLVSEFYKNVAKLYDLGFVPPKILYTLWTETDLKIIPDVLLPIEYELGKALGVGPPAASAELKKLYDDSVRYADGKRRPNAMERSAPKQE